MLGAYRKPYGVGLDAAFQKLLTGKLRMGGAGRMNDKGLDIRHICKQ